MTHTSAICLQKENDLLKFTKWYDLNSDITLPLWAFIKIRWEGLCMIGQDHNDHLDMVLQGVQKDHGARFEKWVATDAQSGHQINLVKFDHLQFG